MTTSKPVKIGLGSLLSPDNCALMLIDHQPFQAAAVKNTDVTSVTSNTVILGKTAKAFNVPALLTSVIEDRGGDIFKQLTNVFPEQTPIDRTFINTWEDNRCVDWFKRTGREKLAIAGLWTEVCVALPVVQALGEGIEVYFVTDASGGVSVEAHEMGIQRMIQAGGIPIITLVFLSELQRDWARVDSAAKVGGILLEHGGAIGSELAWELQLLAGKSGVGV